MSNLNPTAFCAPKGPKVMRKSKCYFGMFCAGFPQAPLFYVLLLNFNFLETDAIRKNYYNFVIQRVAADTEGYS
jgi:hypothetical protein